MYSKTPTNMTTFKLCDVLSVNLYGRSKVSTVNGV